MKETIKMLVKNAVPVESLKKVNNSPNPIIVKIALSIKRLLKIPCKANFTGEPAIVIRRTSLAHPYTQYIPNMMVSKMRPVARLLVM